MFLDKFLIFFGKSLEGTFESSSDVFESRHHLHQKKRAVQFAQLFEKRWSG
jgi:hypothetical protein